MGTINDIGVPGQPLGTPPLTVWQAAVRDALNPLTPQLGNFIPKAGWADYGSQYAGMYVTKVGRLCVVEGLLKPTSDTALTAGTAVTVADVPAGFFPLRSTPTAGVLTLTSSAAQSVARVTVTTSGGIVMIPTVSGSMTAANGYIAFAIAYRSAA